MVLPVGLVIGPNLNQIIKSKGIKPSLKFYGITEVKSFVD